jgi:hypothetical protein
MKQVLPYGVGTSKLASSIHQTPTSQHWELGIWTQFYFSPSQQTIYITQIQAGYQTYSASFIRREQIAIPIYHVGHYVATLPPDSIPTDVKKIRQHYIIELRIPPQFCQPVSIPPTLPQWQNIIVQHTELCDQELLQLVVEDATSDITIVSDGGVHNYHGNFGLVIAHKSTSLAVNYGQLYSIEFYESSYRSELYGVLSGLVTFHHLVTTLKLQLPAKKKLLLYCDNKSVVNKLTSRQELRRTVNQHRHPDVDIEMQVLHEISLLEAKSCFITIQHVRGHQDTQNSKRSLSSEEHLNIVADELTHRARELPHQILIIHVHLIQ